MKLANRLITSLLLISLAVCLALFGLAVLKTNSLLITFPYLTYACTVVVSLFVLSLVLKMSKENIYRTFVLSVLSASPIVLHTLYFFDDSFLEHQGWLFITSLCLTIAIGIASNLNLFVPERRAVFIGLMVITFALILLAILPFEKAIWFTVTFYLLVTFSIAALVFAVIKKD